MLVIKGASVDLGNYTTERFISKPTSIFFCELKFRLIGSGQTEDNAVKPEAVIKILENRPFKLYQKTLF